MDAVSFTRKWVKTKQEELETAKKCVESYHRKKYDALESSSTSKNNSSCTNPGIEKIFQDETTIEREDLFSRGAQLGSGEDASLWSAGAFDQPAPLASAPQPLLNMFITNRFINVDRILAKDGSAIDVRGIFSWFFPRYSLLTDSCRALQVYRISDNFSSCVKCPPGQGPTEDFRECKRCDELEGHKFSDNRQSCERCPEGQWPVTPEYATCKPCNELNDVRFTDNRKSCIKCKDGLTPSEDSTSCLDCTLDDHLLNDDGTRCKKCPSGTWPSTGFECKACSLLDNVRYSSDKTTCLQCAPGLTPSADSSTCLDCSRNDTFFTNREKTRCDICPGGQGATSDHLGCERIHGQWEKWGPWSSCSKSCVIENDGRHGTRTRRRNCTDPEFGGDPCDKDGYEEVDKCGGPHSTITFCPVDGVWSRWREWGSCSRTCGGGTKTRERFCKNKKHGGKDCPGLQSESKDCNTKACPVDGYWGPYGSWSSCSKNCGGGEQSRTRTCNEPKNGGRSCPGDSKQTKLCNTQACPSCIEGEWGNWGSCPQSCSTVERKRTRGWVEPQLSRSNLNCEAKDPTYDFEACDGKQAIVDDNWGATYSRVESECNSNPGASCFAKVLLVNFSS